LWIEKLKTGKYRAVERYTDPMTGKDRKMSVTMEKNTAATRKVAAETLRAKAEAMYAADPSKQEISLQNLLDKYIEYQKSVGIQPNTYRRNRITCQSAIDLIGPEMSAHKLSARIITSKLVNADIQNGTRNNYLVRLKAMLRWGYDNDYLENIDYLRKIKKFPDDVTRIKVEDKFLERSELVDLIAGMQVERWKLLTEFLALSGLRIGEAIALDDADISDKYIIVNKTMDIETEERKNRTKTDAGTREVFIQPELKKAIRKIRRFVRKDKMLYGYRSELFLPGNDGKFLHYDAYRKYLKETSQLVLRREITPHTLRHTHVSLLAEKGLSFEAIARRVGHHDSRITKDIYFHVTEGLKQKDDTQMKKIKIL